MPEQFTGKVEILDSATENPTITLRGDVGDVEVGGGGESGKLTVFNSGDVKRVVIDAETGEVQLYGSDGTLLNMLLNASNGNLSLRGNLFVFNGDTQVLRFNPINSELTVGAEGFEGDLLTTSPTPGHAMKVGDPFKAFGAVIGKAMRPLPDGQGLIPILIALQ